MSYGQPIEVVLDQWYERGYNPLITPFTDDELQRLVAPTSTKKTGMNCEVLALYTCGLVPADVAKYYSDKLAIALDRARYAQTVEMESAMVDVGESPPDVDLVDILATRQKFNEAVLTLLLHINAVNLSNIAYYPIYTTTVDSLLYIFDKLPIGYILPIKFGKPDGMAKGVGSHAISLWKADARTAYLVDIQRGLLTAGSIVQSYNDWKMAVDQLSQNISLTDNYLLIRFQDPGNGTRKDVMRATFVEYMIRQGRLWEFYDPSSPDSAINPKVFMLGGKKVSGFVAKPPIVYKIPHNNEILKRDVYTPDFEKYIKELMDVDTPETFAADLAKLPILFVLKSTPFKAYDDIKDNRYYGYINPYRRVSASSRRLLSGPRRTVRRSSSSRGKGYTRRRRALRSGKGGYRAKATDRKA